MHVLVVGETFTAYLRMFVRNWGRRDKVFPSERTVCSSAVYLGQETSNELPLGVGLL
jgi:hypothetical protein